MFGSFRGISAKATAGLDVVIVDVLRATTTIVFAVSRGARVMPVADEAEALAKGRALGAVLVGEHLGKRLEGFDCNNSQAELGALALAGKTVVITTTNGTKAIAACAEAHQIIAGALTNASAVAEHLAAGTRDIALVCAGRSTGALASEDLLGAGAIAHAVRARAAIWIADGARVAIELFERGATVASSDAAEELIAQGNRADVDAAAMHDAHTVVPVLRDGCFG